MATHDFAPAWLKFTTPPSSTKSSLNFEKHSENFSWRENHYDVSRCRRHNSSDGFDSHIRHSTRGNFRRKEKNGWCTQGRNGTENINHQGGYHGGNSCSRSSIFLSGKCQGLYANSIPDKETRRKEHKRECRQYETEDFPSLNPEYDREPNQNKSLVVGVWILHAQSHTSPAKKISQAPILEYPPSPKSTAPRMLVIKKGYTKGLQLSGFPVAGNIQSQSVKNGTVPNVYKCLIHKPAVPPTRPKQRKNNIFRSGKSQGLHENSIPDKETRRKEHKREHRQYETEDFASLNREYGREPNQNKCLAAGVLVIHAQTHTYPTKEISQAPLLEDPLHPKSTAPRMLVIKKGNTKGLNLSGFPVAGNLQFQPVKNGTGPNFYKWLFPKPAVQPKKPTQLKSRIKENNVGTSFPHESTYGVGNFHTFKSTAKSISPSTISEKECNHSNYSSPVDKLKQPPRLTKLTRIHKDKKSEFFKALKTDRVEEEHKDSSHGGSEKEDASFNLHDSNSTHQEKDIIRNLDENDIPQENSNASVISQQIIRSSTFPQTDVLSSSLEAEHRLLKEMGWQEDSENDETYAPLTEDEMREFQVIREQLQKNGVRKNGILKNSLICDFNFGPWKNSTFKPTIENEDTETSSSETSDDDDW